MFRDDATILHGIKVHHKFVCPGGQLESRLCAIPVGLGPFLARTQCGKEFGDRGEIVVNVDIARWTEINGGAVDGRGQGQDEELCRSNRLPFVHEMDGPDTGS